MIAEWQRTVEQIILATPVAGARVVAITSPRPGAGVSSLCRVAAKVAARAGRHVLVLDLSQPAKDHRGDVLLGSAEPMSDGFDIVTADTASKQAGLFNNADWIRQVLRDELTSYSTVFVDLPPLLGPANGRLNPLAAAVASDAVLLVSVAGLCAPSDVERASELLVAAGAPLIGAVLNDGPRKAR